MYKTKEDLINALVALPHLKLPDICTNRKVFTPYTTAITPELVKNMIELHLIKKDGLIGSEDNFIFISDFMYFMEEYPQVSALGFFDVDLEIYLIVGMEFKGKVSEKMRNDFIRCFHQANYIEAKRSYLLFIE